MVINFVIQKQVTELTEKSKNNEHIIKGKLQEKDEEIRNIREQFTSIQSQMQALITTLGNMDEKSKNKFAKQMVQNGIYKSIDKTKV